MYQKREKALTTWNEEYMTGHWSGIFDSKNEIPRYGVVSGYIHAFNQNADILDLACGQGTLLKYLFHYKSYLGVDFSEEALKIASNYRTQKVNFKCFDIETFNPPGTSDVILFNECLIYFDYPLKVLQRYEKYLREGGAFLISNHVREASRIIWERLDESERYETLINVKISTDRDAWIVKLIKPKE